MAGCSNPRTWSWYACASSWRTTMGCFRSCCLDRRFSATGMWTFFASRGSWLCWINHPRLGWYCIDFKVGWSFSIQISKPCIFFKGPGGIRIVMRCRWFRSISNAFLPTKSSPSSRRIGSTKTVHPSISLLTGWKRIPWSGSSNDGVSADEVVFMVIAIRRLQRIKWILEKQLRWPEWIWGVMLTLVLRLVFRSTSSERAFSEIQWL